MNISSLYLHFPFCRHLCNYCDFHRTLWDGGKGLAAFENQLKKSIEAHDHLLEENNFILGPLKTLYIGGGTPSLWGRQGIEFCRSFLDSRELTFVDDYEFTIEVNPGGYQEKEIEEWVELGCNRFSIGMQTLNSDLIPYLDRVHSIEDSLNTLAFFRQLGVNYSVDLMLGLPHSERLSRNVLNEVTQALDYSPQHMSVYILTTKENYQHRNALPSERWVEREFLGVADLMKKMGFNHYEVSNFSHAGLESQHNLRYWQGESVAAIGPSATGFILLEESRGQGIRYKWKNSVPEFSIENLSDRELSMERFYLMLRTDRGIDPGEFFQGRDLTNFLELAESWGERGLVSHENAGRRLALNSRGFLLLDTLMDEVFQRIKSL